MLPSRAPAPSIVLVFAASETERSSIFSSADFVERALRANLPGVKVNLPSFTEKDRADTTVGLEEGIDFIALSFVREAKDIAVLRAFLSEKKSRCRIIAKMASHRRNKITLAVRERNLAAQLFFRNLDFRASRVMRNYYEDRGEDAFLMELHAESEDADAISGVPVNRVAKYDQR